MFTKRQTRNILVIFSSLFTLSILVVISQVYFDNLPSLLGYKSNSAFDERDHQRYHTVKVGETLADISKKYYGSPKYVETIYEVNQIKIQNKLTLDPGVSLIIPSCP